MIIGGETVLAMTILCTVPNKRRESQPFWSMFGNASNNSFQISTGMSLERKLTIDIEDIEGVQTVNVKRTGNLVEVNVVLEKLEFASFQRVTHMEVDLFDRFPNLRFEFNVVPAEAVEEAKEPTVLHAA